ncbi:MAG: CNNM domain-containing protein [Candidatus Bruticola sp.]
MYTLFFALTCIVFLLLATAIAVAAEFAIVAVDKEHIKSIANNKKNPNCKRAARLLPHLNDSYSLDHCVAACQIIITIASLLIGAIGEKYLAEYCIEPFRYFGVDKDGAAQITRVALIVFFTCLQVVAGELVPKSIATRNTEVIALGCIGTVDWFLRHFSWAVNFLNSSGLFILKFFVDLDNQHSHSASLKDVIAMANISAETGFIGATERQRVTSSLKFPNKHVSDVFITYPEVAKTEASQERLEGTPEYKAVPIRFAVRVKIKDEADGVKNNSVNDDLKPHELIYLRESNSIAEVESIFDKSPYSRLPVYGSGENSASIIGLVHIKDMGVALADGLFEKALEESGHRSLHELTLKECDAIFSAHDLKIQQNIDSERDEAIKKIELESQHELKLRSEHKKAVERKSKRAAKQAENYANERAQREILFPHGFVKRGSLVHCRLDDELDEVREEMKEKYASMAIVEDENRQVLGVLTLEDLLEILSGNSIVDEADMKYAAASSAKKDGKKRGKYTVLASDSENYAKDQPFGKQREAN